MQCAIEIHSAANVYVDHVRFSSCVGARSALKSAGSSSVTSGRSSTRPSGRSICSSLLVVFFAFVDSDSEPTASAMPNRHNRSGSKVRVLAGPGPDLLAAAEDTHDGLPHALHAAANTEVAL